MNFLINDGSIQVRLVNEDEKRFLSGITRKNKNLTHLKNCIDSDLVAGNGWIVKYSHNHLICHSALTQVTHTEIYSGDLLKHALQYSCVHTWLCKAMLTSRLEHSQISSYSWERQISWGRKTTVQSLINSSRCIKHQKHTGTACGLREDKEQRMLRISWQRHSQEANPRDSRTSGCVANH